MTNKNCSIQFTGSSGLLFIDEDDVMYGVNAETITLGEYNKVLFLNSIRPLTGWKEINDADRELIVSKILNLTKGTKWLIK